MEELMFLSGDERIPKIGFLPNGSCRILFVIRRVVWRVEG